MPIEVMDMPKMAREHGKRKVIFNTNRFHAWLHVYPKPGDADDMHCHNADQTFYVIEGECTMHFPDGREWSRRLPGARFINWKTPAMARWC